MMFNKKIGVVIGNNYPKSDNELKFSVADAEKIKEILENKDICGFDEVKYLPDKTSKEALLVIEKTLRYADNDLVFIYFSGHGTKDHEGKLCLLFDDTEKDCLVATSVTFDFINKCVKYPSRKPVVMVLDCCYSCAAEIKAWDTDVTEDLNNLSGSGTVILTSTGLTGSSKAREDEKLGHGIFTYYLIEGLEKGSAANADGLISIDDLYAYASKKTTEKTSEKNCTQFPKMIGEREGTIFIGKNLQKIRENEYNSKKSKLLSEYIRILPPLIINESLTILRKAYDIPPSLESVEETIYDLLSLLLKGEIQPDNYCDAVQHLKGISISFENSQNKNKIDNSKPFTQTTSIISSENSQNKNKIDNSKPFTQTTNVQRSSFQEVEYQSVVWENQNYSLIQIQGEKYIPLKSFSKNKLSRLILDSDDKYTIRIGELLDFGEGYALEAKEVDVNGEKVWLEFTKDGEFVDDEIIKVGDGSDSTWTIILNNIQDENNVSVFKVHINRVFQGMVDSIVQINGLWLIDFNNAFTIKSGDKLNGYEITEINDEYISYKSIDKY